MIRWTLLFLTTTLLLLGHISSGQTANEAFKDKVTEYNLLVAKADSFFSHNDRDNINYINAEYYYREALKIIPDSQYPKDRICLIWILKPSFNDCPYSKDTKKDHELKIQYAFTNADSFLLIKDYDMAAHYYNNVLTLKPDEQYIKLALRKRNYLDSISANQALDSFISFKFVNTDTLFDGSNYILSNLKEMMYADTWFNAGNFMIARRTYGHGFLTMYPYIVNKKKLHSLNEHISKQIKICDEKLTMQQLMILAYDEECDGGSPFYCFGVYASIAEKAEKQGDYQTAMKYYEYFNTDKMEEMKKILEKKK